MKQAYKDARLGHDRLEIIRAANRIIERYMAMGYRLTLRQLYYQFIGQDLFPASWVDDVYNAREGLAPGTKNTVKNYKRLGETVVEGRMCGLIDWDAIEDRGRQPHRHPQWTGMDQLLDAALASYRLDRWEGQKCYAELWCEKDALSGVLEPVADEFHVHFMANKGYSSVSAMKEAAERFKVGCGHRTNIFRRGMLPDRPGVILYLGDHDPSGEDMVRDVRARLLTFLEWPTNGAAEALIVRKVALTWDQVQEHGLPPNPAKLSDSRAKAYVELYGEHSWELDALQPDVLARMARNELDNLVDARAMRTVIKREERDKAELLKAFNTVKR